MQILFAVDDRFNYNCFFDLMITNSFNIKLNTNLVNLIKVAMNKLKRVISFIVLQLTQFIISIHPLVVTKVFKNVLSTNNTFLIDNLKLIRIYIKL